jgi:hypothetical protein
MAAMLKIRAMADVFLMIMSGSGGWVGWRDERLEAI